MAISRENILEVDPGTRRPMADGAVNQLITRRGLDRDRIRLSRRDVTVLKVSGILLQEPGRSILHFGDNI